MKFWGMIITLLWGWSSLCFADDKLEAFELNYVKPLFIQIFSMDKKGVKQEEFFQCTPQTCCFPERFSCFMANGQCVCPLHLCQEWPDSSDNKSHWMVISGTQAERVCRPGAIHDVTDICLCDPNKESPCGECRRPIREGCLFPNDGASIPEDVRAY